jgi:GNAT superfamily N-acetyltransferase
MSNVTIRQAQWEDRPIFAELWSHYLEDNYHEAGGQVLPSDENKLAYLKLFDSYTRGSLYGLVILAFDNERPVGVLLAGEEPPSGFYLDTDLGRIIEIWGVWVDPDYRKQGISTRMAAQGQKLAIELGFTCTMSSLIPQDAAAVANATSGGARILQYRILKQFHRQETPDSG